VAPEGATRSACSVSHVPLGLVVPRTCCVLQGAAVRTARASCVCMRAVRALSGNTAADHALTWAAPLRAYGARAAPDSVRVRRWDIMPPERAACGQWEMVRWPLTRACRRPSVDASRHPGVVQQGYR